MVFHYDVFQPICQFFFIHHRIAPCIILCPNICLFNFLSFCEKQVYISCLTMIRIRIVRLITCPFITIGLNPMLEKKSHI